MAETGSGAGDAFDASAVVVDGDPDEARLERGRQEAWLTFADEADENLRKMKLKVEKAEAHLKGAKEALAEAKAAVQYYKNGA